MAIKFDLVASIFTVFAILCCSPKTEATSNQIIQEDNSTTTVSFAQAQVIDVAISGEENNYTFNVTVSSPDKGCNQYANWWEVIDLDGNLIYRRILAHSHVDEQPFARSGSGIAISSDTEVYIRVHMNNSSYGSRVLKGSVANGFSTADLAADFAKELENEAPLPNGCAF